MKAVRLSCHSVYRTSCAFVDTEGCLWDVEYNGGIFGWGGETTVTKQCPEGTSNEWSFDGNQEEDLCDMLQESV